VRKLGNNEMKINKIENHQLPKNKQYVFDDLDISRDFGDLYKLSVWKSNINVHLIYIQH
jgi:hypothetical protein